VYAHS